MKHTAFEKIREQLDEFADWNVQVTVIRSDLEQLLRDYERLVNRVEETDRSY